MKIGIHECGRKWGWFQNQSQNNMIWGRELNNGSGQGEMNETADPFTITIHFTQNKLHKQGKPNKAKD